MENYYRLLIDDTVQETDRKSLSLIVNTKPENDMLNMKQKTRY